MIVKQNDPVNHPSHYTQGGIECFGQQLQGFRVVAKPEGVLAALRHEGKKCDGKQAERIAWRNVKDWIAAQIALIEAEQATMDELFLPYLIGKDDRTLYEAVQSGQLMLESGISK